MSEETQEGGMSTIKKTLLGLVTTAVTGAGAYVATHINQLFGIEEEETTEQVAPVPTQAPTPIVLNIDNSSQNTNQGGGTTVIKETKVVEKPVKEEKSESEDAPW
jgi:hypothetical protein